MAGPPVTPPVVVPAINKTYSDIRFFVKNPETTEAFAEIPFTGTADGYLQDDGTTRIPYPNEDFDNVDTSVYPFINLQYLSDNYELKAPVNLGTGTVEGDTVTGDTSIFTDVEINTYLLCRSGEETYGGDADGLRVLGFVTSKTSSTEVILSQNAPIDLEGISLEIFTWEGPDNLTYLNNFNFNFRDNFYMAVKNADYTTSNHDGILLIDRAKTASNYTKSPQPFAYSPERIINPNYFSFQRISKPNKPLNPQFNSEGDFTVVDIPCTIKAISKWSEKAMFENMVSSIPLNKIPFWSIYEIDPQLGTQTHLDRNTFYRIVIKDVLPSSRIFVQTGIE